MQLVYQHTRSVSRSNISLIFLNILIIVLRFSITESAFTEVPTSQEIAIGEVAVFRCQHSTADTVGWRVNGTSLNSDRPPGVSPDSERTSDGTIEYTLTITGLPEYNGTTVECVAVFFDVSPIQTTPTATLILQATTETTTETIAEASTSPAYTTNFSVRPSSVTVAVMAEAVFHCQHPTANAVAWELNGTNVIKRHGANISHSHSGRMSTLTLTALPVDNHTLVECVALFIDGHTQQLKAPAVLTVQGLLNAPSDFTSIRNYSPDIVTFTWDPPYSLDLTNSEPDIIYCVEVYDITECGGRNYLSNESRCDVSEPSYTSDTLDPQHIYEIVVTPRSNVTGARNGTSHNYSEIYTDLTQHTSLLFQKQKASFVAVNLSVEHHSLLPSSYTILFVSVEENSTAQYSTEVYTKDGNLLNSNPIIELPYRQRWNLTFHANECHKLNTTDIISTYEVQNVNVTSQTVSGDFLNGSNITASGALIIIYSPLDDTKMQYIFVPNQLKFDFDLSNLTRIEYRVSAFVVDTSRLPVNRSVDDPKTLMIMEDNEHTSSISRIVNYDIGNSTGGSVCINCTFLDSSTKECVAVVHQRISQLNSARLMNIESSHKFTRSGDTASGCIEEVDLTHYQVGVIDRKQNLELSNSNGGDTVSVFAAISTLTCIAIVMIASVLVIIIVRSKRQQTKQCSVEIATGSQSSQSSDSYAPLIRKHSFNTFLSCFSCWSTKQNTKSRDKPLCDDKQAFHNQIDDDPAVETSLATDKSSHIQVESFNHSDNDPSHEETSSLKVDALRETTSIIDIASEGDKKYATVLLPVETTALVFHNHVQYGNISHCQNKEGQQYALCRFKGGLRRKPDDLTKVVYQEIVPPKVESTSASNYFTLPGNVEEKPQIKETEITPPTIDQPLIPFTTDTIVSYLLPSASKWKELGEALTLDEDRLDEIFTNNERDDDCLQEMVEYYMMRPDLKHNWKEIENALDGYYCDTEKFPKSTDEISINSTTDVVFEIPHNIPPSDEIQSDDSEASTRDTTQPQQACLDYSPPSILKFPTTVDIQPYSQPDNEPDMTLSGCSTSNVLFGSIYIQRVLLGSTLTLPEHLRVTWIVDSVVGMKILPEEHNNIVDTKNKTDALEQDEANEPATMDTFQILVTTASAFLHLIKYVFFHI